MYIIKLVLNFLLVFFLFNCARNKKIVNNVAVNNLSNYNYYHKNIYLRGSDTIYIEKFQGVGIDNTVYLNFTYKTNSNSVLFVVEKASLDLKYKYFALKNLSFKPANILLSQCFIDSVISSNEISFYRLKVFSYKNYSNQKNHKVVNGTRPIIRVERFNKMLNIH